MPIKKPPAILRRRDYSPDTVSIKQSGNDLQVWVKHTVHPAQELLNQRNAYVSLKSKLAPLQLNKTEFETFVSILIALEQKLDSNFTMQDVRQKLLNYINNQINLLNTMLSKWESSSSSSSSSSRSLSSSSST